MSLNIYESTRFRRNLHGEYLRLAIPRSPLLHTGILLLLVDMTLIYAHAHSLIRWTRRDIYIVNYDAFSKGKLTSLVFNT